MKKILIFAVMVVAMVVFVSNVALAGGWWYEGYNETTATGPLGWTVPTGSPSTWSAWSDFTDNTSNPARLGTAGQNYNSPHGGYVVTSNVCKTCHAVHLAGANSYRLLKNGDTSATRTAGEGLGNAYTAGAGMGSSRANECMFCHDADTGASDMEPYLLGATNPTGVQGEHTIGSTVVPDSNINNLGSTTTGTLPNRDVAYNGGSGPGILSCYQCHSVHGADTIGNNTTGRANGGGQLSGGGNWDLKILRLNPSGRSGYLAQGDTGAASPAAMAIGTNDPKTVAGGTLNGVDGTMTVGQEAVRSNFCSDCHNQNPNWSNTKGANGSGANPRSHIQGPADTGSMEVYNTTTTVAWDYTTSGCRSCHRGTNFDDAGALASAGDFPHETLGSKLLFDSYTQGTTGGLHASRSSGDGINDASRALNQMDYVCLQCHRDVPGAGTQGVGLTF